jgi:hypothetical protein
MSDMRDHRSMETIIKNILVGIEQENNSKFESLNNAARRVQDTKNRFVPPTLTNPETGEGMSNTDIEHARGMAAQRKIKIIDNT